MAFLPLKLSIMKQPKAYSLKILLIFLTLSSIIIISCKNQVKTETKFTSTKQVMDSVPVSKTTMQIDPSKENVVKGTNGTMLYIPNDAFLAEDGTPVKGKVDIKIAECYALSEMLGQGLSTISDGKILRTGGMINLTASADGKMLKIKDGKAIEVCFPKNKSNDSMQLFYASKDSKGQMNWIPASTLKEIPNTKPESSNEVKIVEERKGASGMPAQLPSPFYYDELYTKPVDSFSEKEFKYSLTIGIDPAIKGLLFRGTPKLNLIDYIVSKKIFNNSDLKILAENNMPIGIAFGVGKDGVMGEPTVYMPSHSKYDKIVFDLLRNAPVFDFSSAEIRDSINLFYLYINPVKELDKQKFEDKYSDYKKKAIQKIDRAELDFYMFSVTKLGWINCDYFWESKAEKIDFVVKTKDIKDTKVELVFKDAKSIMEGIKLNDGYVFRNVPVREKARILGISYKNGKPMMCTLETSISKNPVTLTGFKEFSMEQLSAELNKTN